MITTTLADVPGRRAHEVMGVVIGVAHGLNAQKAACGQMEAQAEGMGVDAIIDVHLQMDVITGNGSGRPAELAIALIGTALKFIQGPPRT